MSWAGPRRFPTTPSRFRCPQTARRWPCRFLDGHRLTYARGLPSPEGLRAHIQLCSISDYIVYSSYKASGHGPPHLPDGGAVRLENALEKLRTWHATLPASLSLSDPLTLFPADFFSQAGALGQASAEVLSGSRSFGHDRACWALHMSYNQVSLERRPYMRSGIV